MLLASGHMPPDASGRNFVAQTLLSCVRTLLSYVRSICLFSVWTLCTRPDSVVLRPVNLPVQRPVAAAAENLDRGVWSLCYQRPVQRPVTSVSSFLHDLACGLVPIFVLGLCLIS